MQKFTIGKNEAGQRFDKFLVKYLPGASKSLLYKQLRKKNITLNEKKASGSESLQEGDTVETFFSDETFKKFSEGAINSETGSEQKTNTSSQSKSTPKPTIVYEDDDILILNKPVGMLSQKSKPTDYSANDFLIDHLLQEGKITKAELRTFKPSICNRLDRNTEGLLLCGCSLSGIQELTRLIREGLVDKFYRTICLGNVEKEFTAIATLTKDHEKNVSTVSNVRICDDDFSYEESEKSKIEQKNKEYIKTKFTPIEHYDDKATLLKVKLHTGKPHQIRAQLSALGHPIYGDVKYGAGKKGNVNYQLLQAYSLHFVEGKEKYSESFNYLSGKKFEIDMPENFKKIIKSF